MTPTIWVLLLVMVTDTPRPVSLVAEFSSRERCEAAGKSAAEVLSFRPDYRYRVRHVCAEK